MIRYRLRSRYKAEGYWTYQEVLDASSAAFQHGRRVEAKPLPKGLRRELEELVDSGELDVRTVPVVDEKPKKRAAKQVTSMQKALF